MELLLATGGTARTPMPAPVMYGFFLLLILALVVIMILRSRR
ncbi:hypothetical protein [Micromonospora sp. KLBMP9576]